MADEDKRKRLRYLQLKQKQAGAAGLEPPAEEAPKLRSASPSAVAASRIASEALTLPLKRTTVAGGLPLPGIPTLESAGETVRGAVKGVSPGSKPLEILADIGALTPENIASNIGGDVLMGVGAPKLARGAASLGGLTTGTGDAVREALEAGLKGGKRMKALISAMRGTTSERRVVSDALDSLQNVKRARSKAYTTKMDAIKAGTFQKKISLSNIKTQLDDLLDDFNIIRKKGGKLDFERAALDDPSINDVKRIVDLVDGWGKRAGDDTVKGLDILKRKIDDFYSPSSEARALVTRMKNSVKKTITDTVPEYDDVTRAYQQATDAIDEISGELSLGPNSKTGTVMRKLKQTLRQNFDLRREFVADLDKAGKRDLISQIAGVELAPATPKGLMRTVAGAGSLAALGTAITNPLLAAKIAAGLIPTSPRLVGEAALAAGRSARVAAPYLRRVPATMVGRGAARISEPEEE